MTDAELVEDVGVVDRDVGNHEIGRDQQAEHVFADVAGLRDVGRGRAFQARRLQRRLDQELVNGLEIDALLDVEGANDERARHARRIHDARVVQTRLAERAASATGMRRPRASRR